VLADGAVLTERDLPERFISDSQNGAGAPQVRIPPGLSMRELERLAITAALHRSGGNRTRAAHELKISVRTLQRKLKDYHIAEQAHA
jgi:two-component system response regulator AtoC